MISRPTSLIIHHTTLTDDVQLPLVEAGHRRRGYPRSHLDREAHVAYHWIVGRDSTVKQLRTFSERSGHTRNQIVNLSSIGIAVAGNFDREEINPRQLEALRKLIARLDGLFHFERIEGHRHASPTSCPGRNLISALSDVWRNPSEAPKFQISRYYSPELGQQKFYYGSYIKDVEINCGLNKDGSAGDCYHTADGTDVRHVQPMTIAACPQSIPLGTRLYIEGIGKVICRDRGGAIKNNKIDLFTGYGEQGLRNIYNTDTGGLRSVTIID